MSRLDILEVDPSLLPSGATPLHIAANSNNTEALTLLLNQGQNSSIDKLDRHGRTPLCIALRNGRFEVSSLLIKAGANFEDEVANDPTLSEALLQSVYQNLMIKFVCQNLKLKPNTVYLQSLLHPAAFEGNDDLVLKLLDTYEVDVECMDHMGRTALHYASQAGNISTVQVLLQHRATVTPQDSLGSTALHLACARGYVNMLNVLLQCSVPDQVLNILDCHARTCAHVALYQKQFKVVEFLFGHFKSSFNLEIVDNSGYSLTGLVFFYHFMLNLFPPSLSLDLPFENVEAATWSLHCAIHEGDLAKMQRSLPLANVETFDYMQHTPLILAVKLGHLEICKALIDAGADPNLPDHVGMTPLHYACMCEHFNIAAFLFSLSSIDPTLFFDSFSQPISLPLLDILLDYSGTSVPKNWQKWLSLAVRNPKISQLEFSKFVTKICPSDWPQVLAQGSYNYIPESYYPSASHPCLPHYIEVQSADFEEYRATQARLRHYQKFKEARKDCFPFKCMKSPALSMKFKKPLTFKRPKRIFERFKGDIHSKLTKSAIYYPLHEAASNKNCAILTYILEEAQNISATLPAKLMLETTNQCKETVAEIMARNFDSFEEKFDESLIDLIRSKLAPSLPDTMTYESALLHYLLVSNDPKTVEYIPSKERRFGWGLPSLTPLDTWPSWYLNLTFGIFAYNLGFSKKETVMKGPRLLATEDKKKLMLNLLEKNGLPDDTTFTKAGYTNLLGASVIYRCLWGAQLLIKFGASPLEGWTKRRTYNFLSKYIRFPLLDAVVTCQTDMIDLLLLNVESMDNSYLQELSPGLLVLVSNGHVSTAEKLYRKIFHKSGFLWSTRCGPRLLYLVLSHGSSSLGVELTKDMVRTVCHSFITESEVKSDILKMMHLFLSTRCMYLAPFQKKVPKEIILALMLVNFLLQTCRGSLFFFHSLCQSNEYDLIQFVTETISTSDLKQIFMKLDGLGRSPLFYAALCGNFDIVKLLTGKGCPITCPLAGSAPELLAVVIYLHKTMKKKKLKSLDAEILQFFNLKSDFSHILKCSFFLKILHGISQLQSLTLVEPLLNAIFQNIHLFTVKTSSESNEDSSPRGKMLMSIVRSLPPPCASSKTSLDLFDQILLKLISQDLKADQLMKSDVRHMRASVAAGMWRVVQKYVPSLSHDQWNELFEHVVSAAMEQRKVNVIASIFDSLNRDIGLHPQHMLKTLCRAVKCNSLEIVKLLLTFKVKVDLFIPLKEAVIFHYRSMMELLLNHLAADQCEISAVSFRKVLRVATCWRNQYIIEQFLTVLLDKLPSLPPYYNDRILSFWSTVLEEAVKNGHEDFTLQAIGCLSENQIKQLMEEHNSHLHILNWCCYWGMKDVLDCLPFSSLDILGSQDSQCCPFVYAVAGGHLGKLSHLDQFPSLADVLKTENEIMRILNWNMLYGAAHKLLTSHNGIKAKESFYSFHWYCKYKHVYFMKILIEAVRFGLAETLQVYIEHLGRYAGVYFSFLGNKYGRRANLLAIACSQKNNLPVVELILKCMFDSSEPVTGNICQEFIQCVMLGEVNCAQAFVHYVPNFSIADKSFQDFFVLECAVKSKSPQMVDYILDLFGVMGPSECLSFNHYSEYPLFCAFSFGCSQVVCKSSLIDTASKCERFHSSLHPDWKVVACRIHGWFNLLMESNSESLSATDFNVESSLCSQQPIHALMSFRKKINQDNKLLTLLQLSITQGAQSIADNLLRAYGSIVDLCVSSKHQFREDLIEAFMHPVVQKVVKSSSTRHFHIDSLNTVMPKLFDKFNKRCGFEECTIQLLISHPEINNIPKILESTFFSACMFGKFKVLDYLLIAKNCTLSKDTWLNGIKLLIYNGHTELAACLMMKLNVQSTQILDHNSLLHLIFSKEGYYKILDSFFLSLSEECQRFSLASSWIVHDWSETEAQLVVKRFGSAYAPPNPWIFSINSQDVTVTIDWDSFSESLLSSPGLGEPARSHFRYTPLLVEAVVFSQVVLGQLIPSPCAKKTSQDDECSSGLFGYCEGAKLSSLIISCVVWPSIPSFLPFADTQGILTISYRPNERVFVFPDSLVTDPVTKELANSPSCRHDDSRASSIYNSPKTLVFQELGAHYEMILKRVLRYKKCNVVVHFSDDILNTDDHEKLEFYNMLAAAYLNDIHETLKLVFKPTVLYTELYNSSTAPPRGVSVQKGLFRTISILFKQDFIHTESTSTVSVSLDRSMLKIEVLLPFEVSETSQLCNRASYNKLIDNLIECILKAEAHTAQHEADNEIGTCIAPKLKASLKLVSFTPDMFNLAFQNASGEIIKLKYFDLRLPQHLIYLKCLKNLTIFLCSFCEMLKVFTYKPRLRANISRLFDAGFQVTVTHSALPDFFVKAGLPHLIISIQQLLSRGSQDSLLHLFQCVLLSSNNKNSPLSSFPPLTVPAPSTCYVDLDQSDGLLYPIKEVMGVITVQLVCYNRKLIKDTHSTNCCLEVRIRHLHSMSITKASSSHEFKPSSATKQFLVKEGIGGTFKIEWTPQNYGLHLISLSVNGAAINGSPHKSFVSISGSRHPKLSAGSNGLRQVTTDSPAVFVVSHLTSKSQCGYICDMHKPPPVILYDKKPIRPHSKVANISSKDDFLQRLFNEEESIHHLSVYKAYGGASSWVHLSGDSLSVHISQNTTLSCEKVLQSNDFKLIVNPLGQGFYRLSLSSTISGSFSIFVSCGLCQSVLKMMWKEERVVLPTSLYVVPGCFSAKNSKLKLISKSEFETNNNKRKWTLCQANAGSSLSFKLKARDQYNNKHTTGGAIKSITIKNGGKPNCSSTEDRSEAEDVICDVSYVSNGEYIVKCQVFAMGYHDIVVMESCLKSSVMGQIRVVSDLPYGSNCRLADTNVYEPTTGIQHSISVELFDRFTNPVHYQKNHKKLIEASLGNQILVPYSEPGVRSSRFIIFRFTAYEAGQVLLNIRINNCNVPMCPMILNVKLSMVGLMDKLKKLRLYLQSRYSLGYTPTLTIDRERVLESSMAALQPQHFRGIMRIRFGDEVGIDMGGVTREFFHLLSLEFVNPDIALFQCVNGLYKPNPNSSANENHLLYFAFFGRILAKIICEGCQIPVRFTPSVYKYLLDAKSTLTDLKIEQPILYRGLVDILSCETDEDLELMATNFTTTTSHFGLVQNIELEYGGEGRRVTMENREEFVNRLCNWHLTGCVSDQLASLLIGFNHLLPANVINKFSSTELEIVLSGQPTIDISFIEKNTKYYGYSRDSDQVKWLWEVLAGFSIEEKLKFVQFCTGSPTLPICEAGEWEFRVQKGSTDTSLLPEASTCFNSIRLPIYESLSQLKNKLQLAIYYGSQGFLQH